MSAARHLLEKNERSALVTTWPYGVAGHVQLKRESKFLEKLRMWLQKSI